MGQDGATIKAQAALTWGATIRQSLFWSESALGQLTIHQRQKKGFHTLSIAEADATMELSSTASDYQSN